MTGSTLPTFDTVRLSHDAGVTTITLARPEALNALNGQLKLELAEAIAYVGADEATRCVVLTGEGRAFCAGGDIGEMQLNTDALVGRTRLAKVLGEIVIPLIRLAKPTVAAINGAAYGAGLSLALACDVAFASESAKMSCAFVRMGLVPDCGAVYTLPRRVPMNIAKDLIFTGRVIGAAEAGDLGLVNRVVAPDDLMAAVTEYAVALARNSTTAIAAAKGLLEVSYETDLAGLADLEAEAQGQLYTSPDHLAARAEFSARTRPSN